ncbi:MULTISPECIES: aldehyde dehydrogenase family protein [Mesorhizobium]|uniref:aldehyde dehydrogenase family protein n=1 Tax=Mesorhizobium TaxID=68287 RepID=UPI000BAFB6C6|nr:MULTISPECIES: aldehyde dehydrogenase family protein [Mesorhizobium]PBB58340.1 aldehyde dehydrogenase family protein [Mesorhizobium loti]PBB83416.1 aldehyde dehydrogenase family protein [Mesorhizobium sp. WSM3876]
MRNTQFLINGKWVEPIEGRQHDVINPATETVVGRISLGGAADIGKAVAAAREAFATWSRVPHQERIGLLRRLIEIYEGRLEEMASAITTEMGAPKTLSVTAQAAAGLSHMKVFLTEFEKFEFEHVLGPQAPDEWLIHEPIGVCGLITPWNWPMSQVCLKVPPAITVGCTVVLKPSEMAPLSSMLFAEFIERAGYPAGVFNLVNGDGAIAGQALARHPDIDMVSFTGSTRAGAAISRAASDTFKRVTLELGGKSPNIIFDDLDVASAAARGALRCFSNTGQNCDAPTRMLVHRSGYEAAIEAACRVAQEVQPGDPALEGSHIGPLSSRVQFERVQTFIANAIAAGARLVAGGPGRPEQFKSGYFVRPTVFADVTNDMQIAREEVFGPVLVIIPFDEEDEAIRIANDTPYGLSSYIQTGDLERAQRVAREIRAGMVRINGALRAPGSPFGGYKHSGTGREGGRWGIEEYLELKAVSGWSHPAN